MYQSCQNPILCSQYYRTFSSKEDLDGHMRTHSEEKIHYLKHHILTHTVVKPYQCNKCNKAFTQNYNLTIHMRTHIGERSYKCIQCNKHFITNSKLT